MQELNQREAPDFILYCGSFDPPHRGHVDCVRYVMEQFPDADVMILPSPMPMQAGGLVKRPTCDIDVRIRMCELAFLVDGGFKKLEVSDLETKLPSPNYTIGLLNWFSKNHSSKRVALLIGLDQLSAFSRWLDPKGILSRVDLFVVKRNGQSMKPVLIKVMQDELGLIIDWCDNGISVEVGGQKCKIHFLDLKTAQVSSTEVRTLLEAGKILPNGWLTPSVEGFIQEVGLYKRVESTLD